LVIVLVFVGIWATALAQFKSQELVWEYFIYGEYTRIVGVNGKNGVKYGLCQLKLSELSSVVTDYDIFIKTNRRCSAGVFTPAWHREEDSAAHGAAIA
jgi:hypothetical protein